MIVYICSVVVNIADFALWIHPIIHQNLTFCYTSPLKHSCSLFYKSMISENSSICKHLRKSKINKKRQGFSSKLIDLGLKIHLPKSCFRLRNLIKKQQNPKMTISELLKKHLVFKGNSHHCFATIQASKTGENVASHNDHRPLHKMPLFRTWPYFIRP